MFNVCNQFANCYKLCVSLLFIHFKSMSYLVLLKIAVSVIHLSLTLMFGFLHFEHKDCVAFPVILIQISILPY